MDWTTTVYSLGSQVPVIALATGLKTSAEKLTKSDEFANPILEHSFALLNLTLSIYAASQVCRLVGLRILLKDFYTTGMVSGAAYLAYKISQYLVNGLLTRLNVDKFHKFVYPNLYKWGKEAISLATLGISCFAAFRVGSHFGVSLSFREVCGISLLLKLDFEAIKFVQRKMNERAQVALVAKRYEGPCKKLAEFEPLEEAVKEAVSLYQSLARRKTELEQEWWSLEDAINPFVPGVSAVVGIKRNLDQSAYAFCSDNHLKLCEYMKADDAEKRTYPEDRKRAIEAFRGSFQTYRTNYGKLVQFSFKWMRFTAEIDKNAGERIEKNGELRLKEKKAEVKTILQELYPDKDAEMVFTTSIAVHFTHKSLFVEVFSEDQLSSLKAYLKEATSITLPFSVSGEDTKRKEAQHILYIIQKIKCFRILANMEQMLRDLK